MMNNKVEHIQSLYRAKEFKKGIEFLQNHRADFSPEVYHYNLGTFFLKDNQAPVARLHFEQAKALGFGNSILENNLKVAKQKLNVISIEQPLTLEKKTMDFFESVNPDWFLTFFLICLLISSFLYGKTRSLILSLCFMLFSISPMGLKEYFNKKFIKAIITQPTAVYDGPSDIYDEIGDLPQGLKIYLTTQRDSWYFIEYPESYRGWIDYSKLNVIQGEKNVF